jgi:hypothetical protein
MMTADPPHTYKVLRNESAVMLDLDPAAELPPVAELKLDLVTLLRLALDNLSGLALSGAEIDLSRLSACHTMLTRLLPPTSLSPAIAEPNFDGAAEEFARLIEQRATSLEARRVHLRDVEVERLTSQIAQRDETIARLSAATPRAVAVMPPASAPPPAPVQTSPQPPLRSSSAPYLRRGDGVVEGRFGPKDWGNHQ